MEEKKYGYADRKLIVNGKAGGGSVPLWGAIAASGAGRLVFV